MRIRTWIAPLLGVGLLAVLASTASEAQAQTSGRIYLTKEKVPEGLKGAKLRKLLRKKRLAVLAKEADAESWTAHGLAKLRLRPSKKLMKLSHNDGKIQIVVRKRLKRRWVRQKVGQLEYANRDRVVRFELSLNDGNGIPARKTTHLELVVLNKRKRHIVLARTTFKIK